MRVLIVLASANRRGAEIEGAELARRLSETGEYAEAVALVSASSSARLDVDVLGDTPLGLRTLGALRRRARSADVVVAYGSTTLPACALALLGSRTPFIYRSIGDPIRWSRGGSHRLRTALLLHRAKRVVALWAGAAQAITDLYRIPQSRIDVVANARDPERFRPPTSQERVDARRDLNLTDDSVVVAFVGSLSAEKRPLLAVESVKAHGVAAMLIAGDGPLRAEVEALASTCGRSIRVLGNVDDVRPSLWASDVLLLTSSTEGLPGSLLEAALCGLPLVATDVGAIGELAVRTPCELVDVDSDSHEFAMAIDRAVGRRTAVSSRLLAYTWLPVVEAWRGVLTAAVR